ncbi:MAG TPA: ABC transporter permease [Gemmatimonadales bacterium]|nr:ABC transporter permease [Gemmatimonadales bacterium]
MTVAPARVYHVWRYRELLRGLVVRNLKVKYQRSLLGFVWTLVNPLLTVTILVVVFSHVVRLQIPNYWAFLLSGYFAWNFMLQTLTTGTWVFAEHSRLTRSVAFPSEILVFSAAGSRLIEFAAELLLTLAAMVLLHHHGVPGSYVLVPLLVVLQVVMAIGLALPIATLSVFYHDIYHALPIALASLFYLSPVFYPASMVPEAYRTLYFLNPIAGLLTLYHDVVYAGAWPSAQLLGVTAVQTSLVYAIGYAVFHRYATVFAEVV